MRHLSVDLNTPEIPQIHIYTSDDDGKSNKTRWRNICNCLFHSESDLLFPFMFSIPNQTNCTRASRVFFLAHYFSFFVTVFYFSFWLATLNVSAIEFCRRRPANFSQDCWVPLRRKNSIIFWQFFLDAHLLIDKGRRGYDLIGIKVKVFFFWVGGEDGLLSIFSLTSNSSPRKLIIVIYELFKMLLAFFERGRAEGSALLRSKREANKRMKFRKVPMK